MTTGNSITGIQVPSQEQMDTTEAEEDTYQQEVTSKQIKGAKLMGRRSLENHTQDPQPLLPVVAPYHLVNSPPHTLVQLE